MESPKPSSMLYKINILSFFPALGLLIPAGVLFSIIPPMGLIPLGFSLINGVIHLRQQKAPEKSLRALTHPIWDLTICLMDLGVLLPMWILDTRGNRWYDGRYTVDSDQVLEWYGSFFVIANMFIHAYLFATRCKLEGAFPRITWQKDCPRCAHRAENEGLLSKPPTRAVGKGPVYSLLGEGGYRDESVESTPRPSEEVQEV